MTEWDEFPAVGSASPATVEPPRTAPAPAADPWAAFPAVKAPASWSEFPAIAAPSTSPQDEWGEFPAVGDASAPDPAKNVALRQQLAAEQAAPPASVIPSIGGVPLQVALSGVGLGSFAVPQSPDVSGEGAGVVETAGNLPATIGAGFTRAGAGLADWYHNSPKIQPGLGLYLPPRDPGPTRVAESMREAATGMVADKREPGSTAAQAVDMTGNAVANVAPTLAAGAVAGPAGAAIVGSAQAAGSSYDRTYTRLTEKGVDPARAAQTATQVGTGSGAIGLATGGLVGQTPGARSVIGRIAEQGAEGVAYGGLQAAGEETLYSGATGDKPEWSRVPVDAGVGGAISVGLSAIGTAFTRGKVRVKPQVQQQLRAQIQAAKTPADVQAAVDAAVARSGLAQQQTPAGPGATPKPSDPAMPSAGNPPVQAPPPQPPPAVISPSPVSNAGPIAPQAVAETPAPAPPQSAEARPSVPQPTAAPAQPPLPATEQKSPAGPSSDPGNLRSEGTSLPESVAAQSGGATPEIAETPKKIEDATPNVARPAEPIRPPSRAEKLVIDDPKLAASWMQRRQSMQQRVAEGKPTNRKAIEPFAGEPWADAALGAKKPVRPPSPDAMGQRKAEAERHLRDVVIREMGVGAADQPDTSPHVMAAMRGETTPGAMISLEGAIRAAENAPTGHPAKMVLHNLRELEKNAPRTKVQAVHTSEVADGTRVMVNDGETFTIDREEGIVRDGIKGEIPDGGMTLYGKKVLPPIEGDTSGDPFAEFPPVEAAAPATKAKPPKLPTAREAIKEGLSYAQWRDQIHDAFRNEQIDESSDAWKQVNSVSSQAYSSTARTLGRHVRTQRGHFGRVEDVAEDLAHVVVSHDDGTTSKQSADSLDDAGAHAQHFADRNRGTDDHAAYLAPKLAAESLAKGENISVTMKRHGISPVNSAMRKAIADAKDKLKPAEQPAPRALARPTDDSLSATPSDANPSTTVARVREMVSDMLDGPLSGVLEAGDRANVSSMWRHVEGVLADAEESGGKTSDPIVRDALEIIAGVYEKADARLSGRPVARSNDFDDASPAPVIADGIPTAGGGKGLFGQPTFEAKAGGQEKFGFGMLADAAKREKARTFSEEIERKEIPQPAADALGSKTANDPKNTPEMFGKTSTPDRAAPEAVNAKRWFHGNGTPGVKADQLDPAMTRADNLFGMGVYLTDSPDIAQGYAKTRGRNGTPTVYEAGVKVDKVLDLEQPADPAIVAVLRKRLSEAGETVGEAIDRAAAQPGATTEDIWRAASEEVSIVSHQDQIPDYEFAEFFANVSDDLRGMGYDAFTHTGGKRTGKPPHQVLILLDPNETGAQVGRKGQVTRFEPMADDPAPVGQDVATPNVAESPSLPPATPEVASIPDRAALQAMTPKEVSVIAKANDIPLGPKATNIDGLMTVKASRSRMRPRGSVQLEAPNRTAKDTGVAFEDADVEKRYQEARGVKGPSFLKTLAEGARSFKNDMTRHFVHLDLNKPDDAKVANTLRLREAAADNAPAKAMRQMQQWVGELAPADYDRFGRMLVLPDILKDIEAGRYEGKGLPFGFRDAAHVEQELKRVGDTAAPQVRAALDKRNAAVRELTERLVGLKILNADVLKDGRYFHRQVMEYMEQKRQTLGGKGPDAKMRQRGFQKGRVGGGDFNTEYSQAEHEYLTHAYRQAAAAEALGRVKADVDISAKLRAEHGSKWADNVPEGYTLWSPKAGDQFAVVPTLSEAVIDKLMKYETDINDVDIRHALAKVPGEQYVIPDHVAKQLDDQPRVEDTVVGQMTTKINAAWKQWTLLSPFRALKYNLNNMSGDTDVIMAADPLVLKHVKSAVTDLHAYSKRKGAAADSEIERAMDLGVTGSGITLNEIPDISSAKVMRELTGGRSSPIRWYWGNVKGGSTFRENVMRLAAYRRAKELIAAGREPLWASKPSDLSSVTNADERAAKLSRELLGDYGNISKTGNLIRQRYIPFWSWMEINAPRYARLFSNSMREGNTGQFARGMAVKAVKAPLKFAVNRALSPVSTVAGATALYGLVHLYNAAAFPGEDDGFEDGRLRLLVGKNSEGRMFGIRFQGAFSDALSWAGLENAPSVAGKLARGEQSIGDTARDMALATPKKLINAAVPVQKTVYESLAGKSFFPDPFNSTPIRDPGEHLARLIGADPVYRYFKEIPQGGGKNFVAQLLLQSFSPGEEKYKKVRGKVYDWLDKNGAERGAGEPTERSNALFYHRRATAQGDSEKGKLWLDRYYKLGGSKEGLETSLSRAHPLDAIPRERRAEFVESLSTKDRSAIQHAEDWYFKTYYGDKAAVAKDLRAFKDEAAVMRKERERYNALNKENKTIPAELNGYAKFGDNEYGGIYGPQGKRLQNLERRAADMKKWEKEVEAGTMTQAEADRRTSQMLKATLKKAE